MIFYFKDTSYQPIEAPSWTNIHDGIQVDQLDD